MKLNYSITGLDCANCASKLESKINKIKGVNSAQINFFTQKLTVESENDDKTFADEIEAAIKKHDAKVVLKRK